MVSNHRITSPPADLRPASPRGRRGFILNLLKYGLGLGLLAFVIAYNWAPNSEHGLAAVWHKYVIERQPINVLPLVLATCICVPAILLTFIRWYILVRALALPFTVRAAVRLGLIGNALNVLLPGSVGGDVIKAACLAREQSRRTAAVATVLVDRAVGLWGLIWLVALLGSGFWIFGRLQGETAATLESIVTGAVGLVAVTTIVWILLGFLPQRRADRFAERLQGIPRVGHAVAEFWRAIWMYRCKGWSIAVALGMSLVGHVGFVLTFYFAAQTVCVKSEIPTMAEHFLTIPIGMAIESGFPTPSGVGGGEYVYGKLYELMGKPQVNGLLGCMVKRILYWGVAFIGYIAYLRMRHARRLAEEDALAVGTVQPATPPVI